MKIGFLSFYYGGVNRGAETFVLELSKRLSENNEVGVISGNSKPKASWPVLWRFYLDPQGIGVLRFTIKNLRKIWKEKYEIVIPMDGGWEALLVRIVTWFYGGKVVISGQSGKGWFDRINILTSPNAFIPLSNWTLNKLKWMNPFVKFVYIPNGVDLEIFKPSSDRGNKDNKTILSVGAFTKQKRHELVINAVSKLDGVNLLIAGGGGDIKNKILDLGNKKLGDRFKLIEVPFSEMPKIYGSADIFTLVSTSTEAFGNVIVEAMATNLPVVVNDDPIRREMVGDAGLLVNPEDEMSYSEALKKSLTTNWGDGPRNQAKKFDWNTIAKKYEELFKELTKKD